MSKAEGSEKGITNGQCNAAMVPDCYDEENVDRSRALTIGVDESSPPLLSSLSQPPASTLVKLSMSIKPKTLATGIKTKTKTQLEFQQNLSTNQQADSISEDTDAIGPLVIPCSNTTNGTVDKWKQRLAVSIRTNILDDDRTSGNHDTGQDTNGPSQRKEQVSTTIDDVAETVTSSNISLRLVEGNKTNNSSDDFINNSKLATNFITEENNNQVNPLVDVDGDEMAAKAILSAIHAMDGNADEDDTTAKLVIPTSTKNRNIKVESNETQQFRNDMESLPDEIPLTSNSYRAIPVSQFGAAMLRGMGWKDDNSRDTTNEATDSNENTNMMAMPRPHRLGIGAMPAIAFGSVDEVPESASSSLWSGKRVKVKTQDRYQHEKRMKQQQDDLVRQKEAKNVIDKQTTMQNGSIIFVDIDNIDKPQDTKCRRRAKVIQLVGAPGLNRVRIQLEGNHETTIIKRYQISQLVPRNDLLQNPFYSSETEEPEQDVTSEVNDERHPTKINKSVQDLDKDEHEKRKRTDVENSRNPLSIESSNRDSFSNGVKNEETYGSYHSDYTGPSRQKVSDDHRDYRHRKHEYGNTKSERSHDRQKESNNVKDSYRSNVDIDESCEKKNKRRKDDEYDRTQKRSRRHDDSYLRNHDVNRYRNSGRYDFNEDDRPEVKTRSSSSKKNRDDTKYETRKVSIEKFVAKGNSRSKTDTATWIIPNIRVRVISKRYGEHIYKKKAIVIDVTSKGATIELPSPSAPVILDRVPERHLETVIPPIGGIVVILSKDSDHYLAKGRLIEKQSNKNNDFRIIGIVQLVEDLDVVALSLDEIAEWCGQNLDEM